MPRPGIGAVFLMKELVAEGHVAEGKGVVYEGEIRGGHLVVGRLASRREVGGDLSICEETRS